MRRKPIFAILITNQTIPFMSPQICYKIGESALFLLQRKKKDKEDDIMMTKDQYIESLRKLHLNLYSFGKKVENVVDNPIDASVA